MAEKEGKTVELLVVPGVDPFDAMVQTAAKLQASRAGDGRLAAHGLRRNWRGGSASPGRSCPNRGIRSRSRSFRPSRPSIFVNLGPHPPRLWPEDVDRLHDVWLRSQRGAHSARSCIIAMWSAWRCAGWNATSRMELSESRRSLIWTTNCVTTDSRPGSERSPRRLPA